MTKKGPLSKAEKFYIENHRDHDVKDLCKDLDRAQSTVSKFLDTLPGEKTAPIAPSKQETLLSQQFARNDKGSLVMTPNASEMADGKRAEFRAGVSKKVKNCTTTIK